MERLFYFSEKKGKEDFKMAKIEGTNKFIIYMYNGKNVRGKSIAKPEHFLGKQWGRISEVDENGKTNKNSFAFTDYGEMITFINKIMIKSLKRNLRRR